jgi:hypothetical protein
MELETQWRGHDSGEYRKTVIIWEDELRCAPWQYIEKCEEALIGPENRREDFLNRGVQKSKLRLMVERLKPAVLKGEGGTWLSGVESI